MPLTPCHAALAWPLHRVLPALPIAAVVIGSMAPDFEYLLRVAPRGRLFHTPVGLATCAIPAALVAWIAWRTLVWPALRTLLPAGVRPPRDARAVDGATVALALAGVTVGALTHVAWDGLTHGGGWGTALWPALEQRVAIGRRAVPIYSLLQHGSTLLGGALLAGWAAAWWLRHPPLARRFAPGQRTRVVRTLALLLGAALAGALLNALRAPPTLGVRLGFAAVGGMLALVAATALWSVAQRARATRATRATADPA